MIFRAESPPINLQPELSEYLARLEQRIAEAARLIHDHDVLYTLPGHVKPGMVRFFGAGDLWPDQTDGGNQNRNGTNNGNGPGPAGSGDAGLYQYVDYDTGWEPLGGGGTTVIDNTVTNIIDNGGITNEALYSYTDTTDITGIGNGTVGYITLGTIDIPTSGYIALDQFVCEFECTGSLTTYGFIGLQIGGTDYVLGDVLMDSGSGFTSSQASITMVAGRSYRFVGTYGNDNSPIFSGLTLDIDQSGCATGEQTVKFIFDNVVSASTRTYAVRGSTGITTRISLRVVDLS